MEKNKEEKEGKMKKKKKVWVCSGQSLDCTLGYAHEVQDLKKRRKKKGENRHNRKKRTDSGGYSVLRTRFAGLLIISNQTN